MPPTNKRLRAAKNSTKNGTKAKSFLITNQKRSSRTKYANRNICQRKLVLWRSPKQLFASFSEGFLNLTGKSRSFEENKLLLFSIIASLWRTMNSIKESDTATTRTRL